MDFRKYSLKELVNNVKTKKISAKEMTEAAINNISKYATGRELDGVTNDYFTVDAMLKFDVSELLPIKLFGANFEPFVGVGPGWTWFDEQDGLTGNLSVGVNHWFNDIFGITLMSEYKQNLDRDVLLYHL